MEKAHQELKKMGIVSFGLVDINQKYNEKKQTWKKEVKFPNWKGMTLQTENYGKHHKGLAIKTGNESNLIVLDIDDVKEWGRLLEEEERTEPIAVKAISGSGGIHYYFKLTDDLKELKTTTNVIKDYEGFDLRTEGGCIIAPPTIYFNKNLNKNAEYTWEKSIFEHELTEMPKWLKKKIFEKQNEKQNEINQTKEKKEQKNIKPIDLLYCKLQKDKIKITDEQMSELIKIVNPKRADDYSTWIEMLFALKCENNDDNLIHFKEFSKRSEKYNEQEVKNTWYKYDASKTLNKINYGSILFWAKLDNPAEYTMFRKKHFKRMNILDEKDIIIDDTFEIEQEYLLMSKCLKNDTVGQYIEKYINDKEKKTLLVRSPYNTGKTTLLKSICDNYKRILFVSYRITLSSNLYGNFKNLGFELYTENIHADKLICQVDSLTKINYPFYDLIIIDESESVLNHFSAGSLKDSYAVFQLFCNLCINSSKIICLDGDLANRTKHIFLTFGSCSFIKNNIKKDIKIFDFTPNQEEFTETINKKLNNKKNICIVSMSEQQANIYYEKYKKEYKTIKYTSKTSDNEKKLLAEVEKIWSSYQIVIYSPSIEAGVDFNIEHFDSIFVIMCSGSTSPRGLNQMINRIRQISDENVLCFTHNLSYTECLDYNYYNFDEVKAYYTKHETNDITFDYDGKNLLKNNDSEYFNIYDILMIYNKQEVLNKSTNCFIPNFIKMIKDKGHKIKEKNEEQKKKKRIIEKNENVVKNNIIEAQRITKTQYEELKIKEAKQNLTEIEKYQITKYIYEDIFDIKFDNKEVMDKYYNKFHIVFNCRNLILAETTNFNSTELQNKMKLAKINTTKKILGLCGINIKNLLEKEIKMNKNEFEANYDKVFEVLNENKIMFELGKNYVKSSRKTLETVKNICENNGIEFERSRDGERKSGEKKPTTYKLNFATDVINKVKKLNKKYIKTEDECELFGLDNFF